MPSLFDNLPFTQAIEALRKRLAISKADFLELDRAARSKAFTMAWVADENVLENIHDELSIAINDGDSYAQFKQRLQDLGERTGWTGTANWHHRLVYETNLGMAYNAGRVQQGEGAGLKVWRYLPSISDMPRVDHEAYYGNLYRMAPGSPVPPIDFNCTCGWEWVFPEELDALGLDPAELPVFDPPVPKSGFVWSPTDYVSATQEPPRRQYAAARCRLELLAAATAPVIRADFNAPESWIEAASKAAGSVFEDKLERLRKWIAREAEAGLDLVQIRNRIYEAMPIAQSNADQELNRLVVLAGLLAGMAKTETELGTGNRKLETGNWKP